MSNYETQYSSGGYQEPLTPMSGMAVGSLVMGIISTLCSLASTGSVFTCFCPCAGAAVVGTPLGIILGIGGLVLGYFGMQECKTTGKRGHGLALAGMITAGVGVAVGLLVVIAMLAFAAFVAGNQPPNQFNNF